MLATTSAMASSPPGCVPDRGACGRLERGQVLVDQLHAALAALFGKDGSKTGRRVEHDFVQLGMGLLGPDPERSVSRHIGQLALPCEANDQAVLERGGEPVLNVLTVDLLVEETGPHHRLTGRRTGLIRAVEELDAGPIPGTR